MVKYIKYIGYGIILSTFQLNLGPISIIPSFLAWGFVAWGAEQLYGEIKDKELYKAKNIAIIHWLVVCILTYLDHVSFPPEIISMILGSLRQVLEIVLYYYLLRGFCHHAIEWKRKNYLILSNCYLLLATISIVLQNCTLFINVGSWLIISLFVMIILRVVVAVWILKFPNYYRPVQNFPVLDE